MEVGSQSRMHRSNLSQINVTPFVDVMLVLLIIFMVAAPLLTVGVPVELPKTAADPLPTEQEEPLTTQPERIRDDYLARFNEHCETLRAGCVAAHIDYALVDTSRPLDALLSEFFHQRQETMNGGSATATRP